MSTITVARLGMDLLFQASNATLAIVLLKETGWRSLVPPLSMWALVARLEPIQSPQPYVLGVAVAAAVVVSVARGARLRALRLVAVVVCAVSTAALQVVARL